MTLNFSQFIDNWPENRKDQFSYEGKKALFEYLGNYEEETGEDIEFDPIAFCCEYTEYENFEDLKEVYPNIENMEDLKDHTQVIPIYDFDGKEKEKFIIQQF